MCRWDGYAAVTDVTSRSLDRKEITRCANREGGRDDGTHNTVLFEGTELFIEKYDIALVFSYTLVRFLFLFFYLVFILRLYQ
jgi:hypothetical protein